MYDTFIIGQISKDINVTCDGSSVKENGGAVIYSGFAAASLDHKTAVLPKGNLSDPDPLLAFAKAKNIDVFPLSCAHSTSIKNVYHTPDKEQRTSTAISRITTYTPQEIPQIDAKIYHIAGLMRGDISDAVIDKFYNKAKIAFDVQGVLRCVEENGEMAFYDWAEKKRYLPKIDFLKADAREAYILTGTQNRCEAAKIMYSWGAKEIMITHYTEVIIYDGVNIYAQPIKSRNFSGRSGRGDTCFSVYIAERLYQPIENALLTAAATVSLKMESPGPFNLGRAAVEDYIKNFYR
jgi:sugar/nucleoside kinase (ribokinase family)